VLTHPETPLSGSCSTHLIRLCEANDSISFLRQIAQPLFILSILLSPVPGPQVMSSRGGPSRVLSLHMTGATDADLEAIDWIEKDVRLHTYKPIIY
jgi:hypothetical protein